MVHSNFLSPEYLSVMTRHLTRNKTTTVPQVTEFLDLYKTHMTSDNFLYFLNCVGKRQLLSPYHIYIVACGLKYVNDGHNDLSLKDLDILFGSLKYMSGRVGGVRCLLQVAAEKLSDNSEEISSLRIGNYLHALRDMKSGHQEVRQMITVLDQKIRTKLTEPLTNADFVLGFSSLGKLSSRYAEVRSLISTLNHALVSSPEREVKFSAEEVPEVLKGFQRFEPEVTEVQEILGTILSKADPALLPGLEITAALESAGFKLVR
jgi:hypothetical protein